MATQTDRPERRAPLSRDRVLRAAVELADSQGIEAVSMRKLGHELGVEAMSLYNHVASKDDLLNGMVEQVMGEIDLQPVGETWQAAMRNLILRARDAMLRHPWAPSVFETRTAIGPAAMEYFNALLGIFRQGGFSYDLAHHAMHTLGSRALGFTQELFEPDDAAAADIESERMMREMADRLPYLIEMMGEIAHDDLDSNLGWCDDQTEFVFALDLILDGLEQKRDAEAATAG